MFPNNCLQEEKNRKNDGEKLFCLFYEAISYKCHSFRPCVIRELNSRVLPDNWFQICERPFKDARYILHRTLTSGQRKYLQIIVDVIHCGRHTVAFLISDVKPLRTPVNNIKSHTLCRRNKKTGNHGGIIMIMRLETAASSIELHTRPNDSGDLPPKDKRGEVVEELHQD